MDHSAQEQSDLKGAPPAAKQPAAQTDERPGSGDATEAIPRELPVLPVREIVVFPGTVVPLTIGREKSKRLIDAVLAGDKLLAICTQRRTDVEDPGLDDIYRVGTAAMVLKLLRMPDGTNSLLVHGIARIGIETMVATEPYWRAVVNPYVDETAESLEINALAHGARQTAYQIIELSPNVPDEARTVLENIDQPGPLADYLAANLSLGIAQKQELLETFDVADRLRKVNATLNNQLEVLQLSQKIQTDVRSQIDKSQREYYLQQQLKAIQKELGETDSRTVELEDLHKKLEAAQMPVEVRKEADREFARLQRIPQGSPENGVIRDYLEWLCDMPWQQETQDNLDLNRAQEVLEADHYGLEKIKRRIIEYLAVLKLRPGGKGPILCFAGPPGVGKTSLGQSIARALERQFIRISLGGVRDEADIRGHRRTYIGAIPGRIVQEIRKAGTRNPVLMLDEMDKLGADFRGDPASALLEVLDPAQNTTFTDHYLGVPFDLSKVLFIGTANQIDPIAPALRDRMEIIELSGYTTAEKFEIARRYLVPRQREENGLADRKIRFADDALRMIIEAYTREAGVRNLERNVGTVLRGLAAKVARGKPARDVVKVADLEEYLGQPRFESEQAMVKRVPGVATGLAYTPVGGDIIFIEATRMPGHGAFTLTGQIGDVMKESAQAALSLLRSRAKEWHITLPPMNEMDIHVHVPAGGVPKDGPSAGVAMLTALVSLMSGKPADPSVAMTGEITLRGQVLPIGGVKAKVLGAHRAGIKTVILPERNRPDLAEVPEDVRAELRFVFAKRAEDVLAVTLGDGAAAVAKNGVAGRRSKAAGKLTGMKRSRATAGGRNGARRKAGAKSRRG